jgi:lipopolysaccharide/colanic/teichoic acid biosynthesis glycosyltransferase
MVQGADRNGPLVTVDEDARITRLGAFMRRARLDELPQIINILTGDMSFVGARPEVGRYVDRYTPEMLATLLMPAGVTSRASIRFKDEAEMLKNAVDADEIYLKRILPRKMEINLRYIEEFNCWSDIGILFETVFAVAG